MNLIDTGEVSLSGFTGEMQMKEWATSHEQYVHATLKINMFQSSAHLCS